ncbi:Cytochrome b/b6 domain protein [Hydrogenobacter thermophilus TK-6]|uniref:Ubiquinol-cytochrome c reductase cytochrome b subunit n=1 Tax=Hydrogenobacter thermophilus (strain DSM 6534 / IAM 12695 / TK-6) TaxID=608538 RepID=D3DIY3_HYDTT|nr:cytochrome bc complex cytochrome b subunit [Hydrogenobacter thermophilus]ADO45710.1 Cytochrome b/b6 domain protein [Hydrogenobacter thermophilus TK-6]BAI69785.1 ubiquinol-cytochrome c reductase cytochrome b subunit [Hydrogenobacter thermophilus TK-6]
MFGRIGKWIDERTHISELWQSQMVEYKVPKNLTFPYAFGVMALIAFAIQIISGIFLTMYYQPNVHAAFDSANYTIMKEIPFMWLFRHVHAAGANFFLALVYLHMFTGIYYNAYKKPRELTWIVGWFIFFILLATALSGYLLPWGQLSYWGMVVTTEIPTAIPGALGETISVWMKGGYELGQITLGRFFGLHIWLLPLILLGLVGFHLYLVRAAGISNPEGVEIDKKKEGVPFHPYMTLKEGAYVMGYLAVFFFFVFFYMHHFLPADNFEPANPFKTPPHIAPEWYLLAFYTIFRSIPQKFLGFIAFSLTLLLLLLLPFLDFSPFKSARKRPLFFVMYIVLVISAMALTILGTMPPTPTNAMLGLTFTATLFAFFISLPVISVIEWGWYKARGGK